jgi:hypothetical protein
MRRGGRGGMGWTDYNQRLLKPDLSEREEMAVWRDGERELEWATVWAVNQ